MLLSGIKFSAVGTAALLLGAIAVAVLLSVSSLRPAPPAATSLRGLAAAGADAATSSTTTAPLAQDVNHQIVMAATAKKKEYAMQAVDVLRTEHNVILGVLAALEQMADSADTIQPLDPADAREAVKFFRGFTDACHHSKEETYLFPALAPHGLTAEHGPVAVMLAEHQEGRNDIKALDTAITALEQDAPDALPRFSQAARAYVSLLRAHITKENDVLFPLASRLLSPTEEATLFEDFERVEKEEMGEDVHAEYEAIANRLAERYGLAPACSGHGHSCDHGQPS